MARDWREFTLRIYVRATPEEVFDAWTASGRLERWFLTKAKYLSGDDELPPDRPAAVGDRYRWEWAEGSTEEGEILRAERPGLLEFTFGDQVTVTVAVREHGGRTLVELTQRHGQEDADTREGWYVSCLQGWNFFLANLKSVLEGGLDLREFNVDVKDLVNV